MRAYESDLDAVPRHVAAARAASRRRELAPAALDRDAIRAFLGELHQRGQSRATAARKLAAVRTFLRYLRREEIIDDDPGALVPTPKREVRMPAHLSEDEMTALIAAPADDDAARPPRPRDPRAVLRLGPALERAGGARSRGRESEREDGAGARQGRQAAAGAVQHQHGEARPRLPEGPRGARPWAGCGRYGGRPDSASAVRPAGRPAVQPRSAVRELSRRHG